MSPADSPRQPSRRTGLVVFCLTLLGFVGVGRLAMEAWLNRPAPRALPEVLPDVLPPGVSPDEPARAYLQIIIDGLRESAAWADSNPPMPWFQSFAREGAHGIAIAGEPTLTAPCVRALLTGRRPDLLTGFRNFNARPVSGSLVEYLKNRGARTAHGGDAAAFQFCRPYYAPEDVLQFPDRGPTDQGGCDLQSVPFVIEKIADGCDAITLHLTFPDHAGHKHGAIGFEYWQACRTVDDQIQRVTEAFLARYPDALVFIAADHGVSPMGTHGGGESSAKRAPFALVGSGVAEIRAEVDQCALVPTIAAVLGLPQPPLADAPPALELLRLPEAVEGAALDAYLRARLEVARDIGIDADLVERRRAELTVERLGDEQQRRLLELASEVNRSINPSSAGNATLALAVAAAWLIVLVHLISVGATSPQRGRVAAIYLIVACMLTFDPVPQVYSVTPLAAALLALIGCGLAFWASADRRLCGGSITLGCLAAMPILTGAGLTLQRAFELSDDMEGAALRMVGLGLALIAALAIFLRPRALRARLLDASRDAPGLVAACGGAILGFSLTLRPFVDPFVHLMVIYSAIAMLIVLGLMVSAGGREVSWRVRGALLAVALALFLATRIGEGLAGAVWVTVTPKRDLLWLLSGGLLVLVLPFLVPLRRCHLTGDGLGLGLAVVALILAYVARVVPEATLVEALGRPGYLVLTQSANVLALGALVSTLASRTTPDARLLIRLLAACALARRLSVMDAEFTVFALTAVGCALAARFPAPQTRLRVAWLAVGLLGVRTAIFHAMGFEESFSTLDVGQAFTGLGTQVEAQSLDAAGGVVITWPIVVATLQVAIRMALPWILILAAAARAFERLHEHGAVLFRILVLDLSVTFAARGAAIITALWAWWRSSWWMTHAYTVYAFGAADVVLLLACSTLCGVWRRWRFPFTEGDAAEDEAQTAGLFG